MGSWAQWTAKTALLAAGFAAVAGGLSGLSGVALAAGGSAGSEAGPGLGLGLLVAPAGACDDAGALLGVVGAACQVGTAVLAPAAPGRTGPGTANTRAGRERSVAGQPVRQHGRRARRLHRGLRERRAGRRHAATARFRSRVRSGGTGSGGTAAGAIQRAVAPVTSVLGVTAPAPRGLTGERVRSVSDNQPGASGAGDTNVPAASQLAGLGALPGLADLPSLAGLANMPALNGVSGGGIPMPGTALSAASTSGMSSDSFAALAAGALLAGASALKIAGRRARDRKAGFGAMI